MINLKSEFKVLLELEDKKQDALRRNKVIQSMQPFCQPYDCFWETLDEAVKIGDEQVKIWNNIRGFLTSDKKTTLWQLAIEQNYPIHRFGKENILSLEKEDLIFLREAL